MLFASAIPKTSGRESLWAAPPRILRVITRLNVGGPSIHVVLLTRELASKGYHTVLVSGMCEEDDGNMSYLLNSNDSVRWIPDLSRSVRPWKNLRGLVHLWRTIRAERPTIVHTHTAMAGCIGRIAARAAGVPILVHTFHGNSLQRCFSRPVSAVFLQIERWLAKFTDVICVVSEEQAFELSQVFRVAPRPRLQVVPLGVDLAPYLPLPVPEIEDGCLRVGWFGRLVPVKDPALLVRVVEATTRRGLPVEYHVAGDGPARDVIKAAASRPGSRLIWHGWQQDVVPLLRKCHVLLQTSVNEGTPLALVQGMAAARPFISTRVGGVVDLVTGSSRRRAGAEWFSNGVLADPDPDVFSAVLADILAQPSQLAAMGASARTFAAERHGKEQLCETLDALYRDLIDRKLANQF